MPLNFGVIYPEANIPSTGAGAGINADSAKPLKLLV